MDKIISDNVLKRFGITMGLMCVVVSVVMILKHSPSGPWMLFVAGFFLITGFVLQVVLKPLYTLWKQLTTLLAWINTRLILTLVYYLVFTPIGLVLRILRIDLLELKINRQTHSYWKPKEQEKFDPSRYSKLF